MSIDPSALAFDAPRSPAASELNRLLDARAEVVATMRDAEYAGRTAGEAAHVASSQLSALEARRLGGDDVTDAERKKAEKRLAESRARQAEPWGERVAGARRALANADAAISRFIAANYDVLAGEVAEDAQAVKDRADEALQEIGRVYAQREDVVRRSDALIAVVARVKPGQTPFSKLEPVVREAERVLMSGGEDAPIPKRDPRVAEAGTVPEFSA
jgi:hypothetical protein